MFQSENSFGIEDADFKRLTRWRTSTFFVMLFGYIGYYLVRQNFSVAIPLMHDSLGFSNQQLGLVGSLSEGAYAFGKLLTGPWSDKRGGRKVFLIGLAGAILCNFLFTAGSTLNWFIFAWCLCRFFLSMGWGGLAKVIGNWFEPEKNGVVMGWISINFQFGGVVAGALAGYVVALGGGWRDVFIYPAITAAVVLVYSFFASKDSPQKVVPGTKFGESPQGRKSIAAQAHVTDCVEKESIRATIKNLLLLDVFRNLLVFSFFMHFLRSVFTLWAPKLLIDIGLGTTMGIFSSLVFPLLGCVGTILLGWYTDRYVKNGDRARIMWIMLVGLTATVLAMGLMIIGHPQLSPTQLTGVVVLLGATGFFLYGPYSMSAGSLSLDIAGSKAAGTCTGLIDCVGYIGGTIAVYAAGVIADKWGWGYVCLALSFFSLLSTIAAWRLSVRFQSRARLSTGV